MEIGKTYAIVYDDKGFHPVRKTGRVKAIQGNLITLESGEILNAYFVIRANIVEGGINGTARNG